MAPGGLSSVRPFLNSRFRSIGSEERNHGLHHAHRFRALGVTEMEHMLLPLRLHQPRLPFPPAPLQRLVVRPPPLPQYVLLRHRHQHPPARQPRHARCPLRQRVQPRVVRPHRSRAHQRPDFLRPRPRLRIPAFRPQRFRPPEVRVDQQKPLDRGCTAQPLRRHPQRHLMHDVGARAVPCQEHPPQVPALREPLLRRRPRRNPLECRPRVVVRGRERVLRRAAVVHGHGHHAGRGHEGVEVVVVRRGEGGLDDEAAAMVVDKDWEFPVRWATGEVREVEAGHQVGGRVDEDVLGDDAGGGVEPCGEYFVAEEAFDAAALEDADERWRMEHDFGICVHGCELHGRNGGERGL
ncbi:unnamed protein product [Musa hybrid cultivar]